MQDLLHPVAVNSKEDYKQENKWMLNYWIASYTLEMYTTIDDIVKNETRSTDFKQPLRTTAVQNSEVVRNNVRLYYLWL